MGTEISQKPIRQVANVRELLINDAAKRQIAQVAAKHLNDERITGIVAKSLRLNPKLGEAEPLSMLGAVMTCASLGLEPDPALGLAYLVPFKTKAGTQVQVIVGYRGLMALARRSGEITSISANIHYEDDPLWEYEEGTDAKLRHVPGDQEGAPLHAYAVAKFRDDGGHAFVVLPWKHVMRIRDGSQGWQTALKFNSTDKSPWKTHEAEMAKKTAIRALAKYLPMSVEMQNAMGIDGQRADFRAFAMDPKAGVPAGDEGDTIEGEAEEVDETPAAIGQKQEITVPAETGREAVAETAQPAAQACAGAAAPTEQHPNQGAAAPNRLASAQERARAAVAAKRAERAGEASAQEAANAAAPATPEDDDAMAKYRGWADRIRVDIDDIGGGALTDWQAEMAELDEHAPDLARELRDYAAA